MDLKAKIIPKIPIWVLYMLAIVVVGIIATLIYRKFFMVDKNILANEIGSRAASSTAQSGADTATTVKIIKNEADEITNSITQTMQLLDYAKASGMTKEAALADTAYNSAKAKGYLM
ncbi:MAG: hypothetical protein JST67_00015 [Bacteroidetes bacterium]|nr:hypothetical protein [Bacteroidota bacterium]